MNVTHIGRRLTGVKQESWKGLVHVRGTQACLCHRAFICWGFYILEVKGGDGVVCEIESLSSLLYLMHYKDVL